MSFSITLNYKEETYTSDVFDDSKYEQCAKSIQDVATGIIQHLSFTNGVHEYYFPEKVLQESIITITKVK